MLNKIALFVAFVAVAQAGLLPVKSVGSEDTFDAHPQYAFNYDVQDGETGDVKSQSESRDGDVVRGQYSVNDADGYRRIVEYSVDAESGFNAVVRREPLSGAAAVVARPAAPIKLQPLKKLPVLKPHSQASAVVHRSFAPASTVIHHAPVTHHVVHHAAPSQAIISHHVPVLRNSLHAAHPQHISYVF
ncbi:pupal cuticle protein Edg-84A [Drosophila obscura]|uniref:pupal cuticle protein Edg-84A n=1 Tax=Drosophila obscura TaxID=7282 RepID=UPI000BA05CCE|nr:pupal cuticle protein Edg-84A [Drosophila obscura]